MRQHSSRQVEEILTAIHQAHADHADDLCWMSIDRIFKAAGLHTPDRRVGHKGEMLLNCARYIDRMCEGGHWPTYKELEHNLSTTQKELLDCKQKLEDSKKVIDYLNHEIVRLNRELIEAEHKGWE